jgi:hypothetical protein
MTENNTAVAAALPESMYNRWETMQKVNVMDSIHSIKIYNAIPWKAPDAELAWKIMIKRAGSDLWYEPFQESVWVNIIKIRKGMNGAFNILDAEWNPTKDNNGDTKRSFAFTEEYPRFSKNTTEIFFKNNDGWAVTKNTIWNLKELFKTPFVWWRKNPFHKIALKQDGTTYDSTFISEWYIIYGVFTDWHYAWETFRLFMSSTAFGSKWDASTKTNSIVEWSLAKALEEWFSKFQELKTTQGIDGRFDDSLLVSTLSSVKDWNFFKPNFSNNRLVTVDNTEEYNAITQLEAEYKEQEFSIQQQEYAQLETWTKTLSEQVSTAQSNYAPMPEWNNNIQEEVKTEVNKKTEATVNDWISIEDCPF